MKTRYGVHPDHFKSLDTTQIRDEFLAQNLLIYFSALEHS